MKLTLSHLLHTSPFYKKTLPTSFLILCEPFFLSPQLRLHSTAYLADRTADLAVCIAFGLERANLQARLYRSLYCQSSYFYYYY